MFLTPFGFVQQPKSYHPGLVYRGGRSGESTGESILSWRKYWRALCGLGFFGGKVGWVLMRIGERGTGEM